MRLTFINTLIKLARRDKNVWLITGDLGYGMIEPFIKEFPDRFLNVGVAEQNMVGIAAGMALTGKKVFVYSISTFATMRPYEQIRNDVCYHNLPVFIVGGGSAFSYSLLGCTHQPLEDLGIMSILPNMAVLSPGDPIEVEALVVAAYKRARPAYIRLARKGEPKVYRKLEEVKLGKMSVMKNGKDATIIVTGRLLPDAILASEILYNNDGLSIRVLSAHTLKPIDEEAIISSAKETGAIITCEEHLLFGGLASLVSNVLVKNNIVKPVISLGIPDEFPKGVGWQKYFLERYGLTPEGIAAAARKCLKIKNVKSAK